MGISDHLIYLLRNLYADQETTARTGHGTTDWFQIGKGLRQGCILSATLGFMFFIGFERKMLSEIFLIVNLCHCKIVQRFWKIVQQSLK